MIPRAASKFGNQPTEVDGRRCASRKEARRYSELRLMERAGQIGDLQCQVGFKLDVNGVHICRYVADFAYVDRRTGRRIIEDSKGYETREFKMKSRLMKAVHDIDVVTV